MDSVLPKLNGKKKICIICEGAEEYDYINRLISLNVWHYQYHIHLINAEGNGNLVSRYQNEYQIGRYDIIFIICDTEKKPYKQFDAICNAINEFHDSFYASQSVIIFTNPCTMQAILLHFDHRIRLNKPSKKHSAPYITTYTGVENYSGKEKERNVVMDCLTVDNYKYMMEHINMLSTDPYELNSSNIGMYWNYFESSNSDWVKHINRTIELSEDEYDDCVADEAYKEYVNSGKQSRSIEELWEELNL